MTKILREVEENIFANSTLYSTPRFFGYINGSGHQAAVVAELLASSINQICAKWHFSPAASEVERQVIQWIAHFIGYPPDGGGCLLSGGSAGNLAGLAVARRQKAPFDAGVLGMTAGPPLTVYVSREGHASLDKAMALLGMGCEHLRKIPVLDDFTIDLKALEQQVRADRANGYHLICGVGNAGTINTGAVDPLNALAEFCGTLGGVFPVPHLRPVAPRRPHISGQIEFAAATRARARRACLCLRDEDPWTYGAACVQRQSPAATGRR
jgi:aromatic-L-amino-acid decarboxylase